MSTSTARRLLTFGLVWALLASAGGQAAAAPAGEDWTHQRLRDSLGALHAGVEAGVAAGRLDEEAIRARSTELVRAVLAEGTVRLRADAINGVLDVANRLDSRGELLTALSDLGYGLDLSGGDTTDLTPLLFTLGNLEKARGDQQAARMWFDSTVALLHGPHTPLFVAAAAKLNGGLAREEGRYAEGLRHIRLAASILDTTDAEPAETLHMLSTHAAALVDAGGDLDEALRLSTAAYEGLNADSVVRREWTYAYIIYLDHAYVLAAAERAPEALAAMREALALTELRGDRPSQSFIHLKLARLQSAIGDYRQAEASALRALRLFEELAHDSHLAEAHELLEELYERNDATLRQALHHAREAHRMRLAASEDARAEGLLALRNDHRRATAEHRAQLAEQAAATAALRHASVAAQRTSLLTAVLLACGILAFVLYRLRARRRHGARLEALVEERTAQLAAHARELESRSCKLDASNRELERFAFIASHDLKTPLRNVTSFLGLIDRRMPPEARPALGEYVELARGYARKMHALVTDVLEFSRLNDDLEGLSEVVDLRALCLELVAERTGGRGDVAVSVVGAATLQAPPVFLRQVVGNLVDNGLKYNESPLPRVTVELRGQTDAAGADGVEVRVRDNGIGIAPEYHGYVFELFRRLHTDDVYTGTGLGLATCAKVVRRMGGRIDLESAPGEGSTFVVWLPVNAGVAAQSSNRMPTPGSRASSSSPMASAGVSTPPPVQECASDSVD